MHLFVLLFVLTQEQGPPATRLAYETVLHEFRVNEGSAAPIDALAALSIEDARRLEKRLDDASMTLEMKRAAIVLHTLAGVVAESHGQRDERVWHFEHARRIADRLNWTPFKGVWLYAIAHYHQSKLEEHEALEALETLSGAFPRDPVVALALGTLHETMGSVGGDGELGALPSPWPVVELGGSPSRERIERRAMKRSRLARAAELFRLALSEDPDLDEARVRLGRVSLQLGRREEAERQWSLVIDDENDSYWRGLALLFRGRLREHDGALASAIEEYRGAAGLRPELQIAHVALSHALYRSGDPEAGMEAMGRALAPRDPSTAPWNGHARYFFRLDVFIDCILLLDQRLRP